MKNLGWLFWIAAFCTLAGACGNDDLPLGARGSGGRGATGTGGVSVGGDDGGRGGSAGTAGSAGGGGDAGQGGHAGRGGEAGRGGSEPEGGCSNDPGLPAIFVCDAGASTCSLEATRAALGCGEPTSNLDVNCCKRPTCRNDADCGTDGACIPRLVQEPEPDGSEHDMCGMECGQCVCSTTADIDQWGYCIGPDDDLTRFNCDTRGLSCEDLEQWRYSLSAFNPILPTDLTETGWTDFAKRTSACSSKVASELATRCNIGPACDCTGDHCTQAVEDFHPFGDVLGRPATRETMNNAPLLCANIFYGRFSSCSDGTDRFELGSFETFYILGFDSDGSSPLLFGHAEADVGGLCHPNSGASTVDTGPWPRPTTTCRTCSFCSYDPDGAGGRSAGGGGAGSADIPDCVVDRAGRIALPTD